MGLAQRETNIYRPAHRIGPYGVQFGLGKLVERCFGVGRLVFKVQVFIACLVVEEQQRQVVHFVGGALPPGGEFGRIARVVRVVQGVVVPGKRVNDRIFRQVYQVFEVVATLPVEVPVGDVHQRDGVAIGLDRIHAPVGAKEVHVRRYAHHAHVVGHCEGTVKFVLLVWINEKWPVFKRAGKRQHDVRLQVARGGLVGEKQVERGGVRLVAGGGGIMYLHHQVGVGRHPLGNAIVEYVWAHTGHVPGQLVVEIVDAATRHLAAIVSIFGGLGIECCCGARIVGPKKRMVHNFGVSGAHFEGYQVFIHRQACRDHKVPVLVVIGARVHVGLGKRQHQIGRAHL